MNLNPVFCSFIAIEHNIDIDNISLESYCKHKIHSSLKFKFLNNTQSDHLQLSDSVLKPITELIQQKVNDICSTIGIANKQSIVRAWANLNNTVAINQPHSHNSVFSCVYYVKGDEYCGDLTFINPITALNYVFDKSKIKEQTAFTASEMSIPPTKGSLVIFPSWLTHYVRPNFSNNERISLAFETDYI